MDRKSIGNGAATKGAGQSWRSVVLQVWPVVADAATWSRGTSAAAQVDEARFEGWLPEPFGKISICKRLLLKWLQRRPQLGSPQKARQGAPVLKGLGIEVPVSRMGA